MTTTCDFQRALHSPRLFRTAHTSPHSPTTPTTATSATTRTAAAGGRSRSYSPLARHRQASKPNTQPAFSPSTAGASLLQPPTPLSVASPATPSPLRTMQGTPPAAAGDEDTAQHTGEHNVTSNEGDEEPDEFLSPTKFLQLVGTEDSDGGESSDTSDSDSDEESEDGGEDMKSVDLARHTDTSELGTRQGDTTDPGARQDSPPHMHPRIEVTSPTSPPDASSGLASASHSGAQRQSHTPASTHRHRRRRHQHHLFTPRSRAAARAATSSGRERRRYGRVSMLVPSPLHAQGTQRAPGPAAPRMQRSPPKLRLITEEDEGQEDGCDGRVQGHGAVAGAVAGVSVGDDDSVGAGVGGGVHGEDMHSVLREVSVGDTFFEDEPGGSHTAQHTGCSVDIAFSSAVAHRLEGVKASESFLGLHVQQRQRRRQLKQHQQHRPAVHESDDGDSDDDHDDDDGNAQESTNDDDRQECEVKGLESAELDPTQQQQQQQQQRLQQHDGWARDAGDDDEVTAGTIVVAVQATEAKSPLLLGCLYWVLGTRDASSNSSSSTTQALVHPCIQQQAAWQRPVWVSCHDIVNVNSWLQSVTTP
ncbi:hypothetical protein PTSG_05056 [Salpingoeca rosetta]|uniref:Uncharacterized protein n=1 Tax=Salpingoeca rosetta (strain ATCC 50818 / BSB-021) TaxID=946362 RepID=F2U9E1_SALR5|nr:uncharacterized protein PTSG_05056 [Salpingoeca rosetta]EGD73344.1 hypothetical protein PTSG_05056 [Salpingoeca rosetta]|eukprot:XP_004994374.1 hypothetical protein PTSG_05056 [Salpingoeca rosetta]